MSVNRKIGQAGRSDLSIKRSVCFKELAHMIVEEPSPKSAGRLVARVNVAV